MSTKLTLSLKRDVIEKAKQYAKLNHTSLSVLVENYFRFVTEKRLQDSDLSSPLVEELSGIIELPNDFNLKDEYTDYLVEKYQ